MSEITSITNKTPNSSLNYTISTFDNSLGLIIFTVMYNCIWSIFHFMTMLLFVYFHLPALPLQYSWASLVAQLVKNPSAMWETWVWSLGWEDPLEKGKATHSSILAWRIPRTVSSWHHKESDTTERLSLSLFTSTLMHPEVHLPVVSGKLCSFCKTCSKWFSTEVC